MEADPKTLLVDSESWNEALYSGSLVDCQVDLHTAKRGLVKTTLNTQFEEGQSA